MLLIMPVASIAAAIPTYNVGIVPQQNVRKTAAQWIPLLEFVGQEVGVKLRFVTAKDIADFEAQLQSGKYDMSYLNPQQYVEMKKVQNVTALVHERDRMLQGIIVVHKNSEVTSIEQLNKKEMIFPSRSSFAASLLPLAELETLGITVKPVYVNNHESVYRNVALKRYIAGGGISKTLNDSAAEVSGQLRILWKSKLYHPHVFTAHPRVEKKIQDKLQQAFILLSQNERGRTVLNQTRFNGFVKADDRNWNDVRTLDLDSLRRK